MDSERATMLVLGVGNELRGDDAAGLLVARRLREAAPPGVVVREASGEGAGLIIAWQEAGQVWLVDAVHSGAAPGTVQRFVVEGDANLPLMREDSGSTHSFGVAGALELARALGWLPPRLVVVGIEGAQFDPGAAVSPPVAAAVEEVADQLLQEIGAAEVV